MYSQAYRLSNSARLAVYRVLLEHPRSCVKDLAAYTTYSKRYTERVLLALKEQGCAVIDLSVPCKRSTFVINYWRAADKVPPLEDKADWQQDRLAVEQHLAAINVLLKTKERGPWTYRKP